LAAVLDFLEIKPEGSVSQNVSGSQMNQYDMAFEYANFGTFITKCSSLLPRSPTKWRQVMITHEHYGPASTKYALWMILAHVKTITITISPQNEMTVTKNIYI